MSGASSLVTCPLSPGAKEQKGVGGTQLQWSPAAGLVTRYFTSVAELQLGQSCFF